MFYLSFDAEFVTKGTIQVVRGSMNAAKHAEAVAYHAEQVRSERLWRRDLSLSLCDAEYADLYAIPAALDKAKKGNASILLGSWNLSIEREQQHRERLRQHKEAYEELERRKKEKRFAYAS